MAPSRSRTKLMADSPRTPPCERRRATVKSLDDLSKRSVDRNWRKDDRDAALAELVETFRAAPLSVRALYVLGSPIRALRDKR
jgi:hypothetical protein